MVVADPASLTRHFWKPSRRCPSRSISWKELPVVGSFFRQRRVAIGFDQSAPASLQRTKLLTPSVATAGIQGAANCNDRVRMYACRISLSIDEFCFSTRNFQPVETVWKCDSSERPAQRDADARLSTSRDFDDVVRALGRLLRTRSIERRPSHVNSAQRFGQLLHFSNLGSRGNDSLRSIPLHSVRKG